jgi:hypothetical protein
LPRLWRTNPDSFGNPPFRVWREKHPAIAFDTFAAAAGEENLAGKILIDIANPLDFSRGLPPSLTVCNTDSKTLNTMNAYLMVQPLQLASGDHTVFVCGNDAEAKRTITELLRSLGWRDIGRGCGGRLESLTIATGAKAAESRAIIRPPWSTGRTSATP